MSFVLERDDSFRMGPSINKIRILHELRCQMELFVLRKDVLDLNPGLAAVMFELQCLEGKDQMSEVYTCLIP